MSGDPLGFPYEIMIDLGGGDHSGHSEAPVIAGPAILEQVIRDGVVRLAKNLFVFPGRAPDSARDDMAEGFQIADVKTSKVIRGRSMPELVGGKIEAGQPGEVAVPTMAASVHGQRDVSVMLQEGDTVPGVKCGFPPLQICFASGVDQHWGVVGGSQTFIGENPAAQETTGADNIRSVKQLAGQRCKLLFAGVSLLQPFVDKIEEGGEFLRGKGNCIFFQVIEQSQGHTGRRGRGYVTR